MSQRMTVRPSALIIQDGNVLLLEYQYGGHVVLALPGGNPDSGESLTATVQRELYEELGVTLRIGGVVVFGEVAGPPRPHDTLHVVFSADITEGEPVLRPAETSARAVRWVPLADLTGQTLYPNVTEAITRWQRTGLASGYVGPIDQPFF